MHGESKVCGRHAVYAVLRGRPDDVIRLYLTDEHTDDLRGFLRILAQSRRAYHIVDSLELERISDSTHHEGLCLLVRDRPKLPIDEIIGVKGPMLLGVLDSVSNPHNVGAIARVAANFGARALWVRGERTTTPAMIRTAEGATEFVELRSYRRMEGLCSTLKKRKFVLIGTSSHAEKSLWDLKLPSRVGFILGAEGVGMSEEGQATVDSMVRIPGTGAVESLNVATASAILFAEWFRLHGRK